MWNDDIKLWKIHSSSHIIVKKAQESLQYSGQVKIFQSLKIFREINVV